jgi:ubiquinone/menaquinone biosynthesis C-methylase UbiE
VLDAHPIREYLGLDLSAEHVRLCRSRLSSHGNAHFAVADARRLPVKTAGFEAVFSIEAAQHFEDRGLFYREAARALRPGGAFFLASIWRQTEIESRQAFEACGLTVAEHADITPNVVGSLARSGDVRRRIVESLQLPERFTPLLMSWAGVRGYTAYEGLASGALVYQRFVLVRTS